MTHDEFKQKFPIGSTIRLKYEVYHYGEIVLYDDFTSSVLIFWKTIKVYNGGKITYWYNTSENIISNIELVSETKASIQENSICPRCSNEMVKKQTDQYGLIDKCPNCGYC